MHSSFLLDGRPDPDRGTVVAEKRAASTTASLTFRWMICREAATMIFPLCPLHHCSRQRLFRPCERRQRLERFLLHMSKRQTAEFGNEEATVMPHLRNCAASRYPAGKENVDTEAPNP